MERVFLHKQFRNEENTKWRGKKSTGIDINNKMKKNLLSPRGDYLADDPSDS